MHKYFLGPWSGACVLLQQKMQRDLLFLACRHHILELVLRNVYEEYMGKSKLPEVELFNRFKKHWSSINITSYKSGIIDKTVSAALLQSKPEILSFAFDQLKVKN